MNKRSRSVLLGILGCIMFTFNHVNAVDQAYFTTDRTTPLIGEPVQLVLHLIIPQQAKLILPDFETNWSPFFVKEVGSLKVIHQVDNSTIEYELLLTVILWETGQHVTPSLVVSYQVDGADPVNLVIESIQFVVPSVLDANDSILRPMKPQINLAYFPVWTLVIVLVIVVILSVVAVHYHLTRIRRAPAHPDSLSDKWHPEAKAALIALRQFGQSQDNPSTIYVQVSDCLRHYLTAHFAVQASDLTTGELMMKLEAQQAMLDEHQQKLADMLRRADLVKFARVAPKLGAAQQYALVAAQWIQSIEQTPNEHLS